MLNDIKSNNWELGICDFCGGNIKATYRGVIKGSSGSEESQVYLCDSCQELEQGSLVWCERLEPCDVCNALQEDLFDEVVQVDLINEEDFKVSYVRIRDNVGDISYYKDVTYGVGNMEDIISEKMTMCPACHSVLKSQDDHCWI